MKTILTHAARLLEAAESMTDFLRNHTDELARGEAPHVFTATDIYAELQEATTDLRHAIDLGEALASVLNGDIQITSPVDGLVSMHELILETNPYAYFELAFTRPTGWMAWICDKPGSGMPGTPEWEASRTVFARGQGETHDEACENAIESLLNNDDIPPGVIAPVYAETDIPY